MERKTLFADVILPLPVKGMFTYRVPYGWNGYIMPGQRVAVQFGKKKLYTGLVRKVHENIPKGYSPKYLLSLLDEKPIVTGKQFSLWEWMTEYYMCHTGEVMNAALPSAFKLASESKLRLHPGFRAGDKSLSEKEALIAEALIHHETLSIKQAADITDQLKVLPLINTLIEKEVIFLDEELIEQYKPKLITIVSLAPAFRADEALEPVFSELEKRAFKQLQILLAYIRLSGKGKLSDGMEKSRLLKEAGASQAQLNALVKKGIFITEEKEQSRLQGEDASLEAEKISFSDMQAKALQEIRTAFATHEVCLLHGVTSSGKTEIYIRLIQETLERGEQVLYLLPEIALTTQIISRLQKFFGRQVGVYHSRYNERERVEIWNKVLDEDAELRYNIILGARSALFLPFRKLGLVIVDEEHDQSYKQFDPAPRYQARDAAIVLASMHKAKTLLGTATPSFESYFNARAGKYHLIELQQRYRDLLMPEIIIADVKKKRKQQETQSHFTDLMLGNIEESLRSREQVILFQNRRGFAPRLECEVCGWMPMCVRCDITLTYHKKADHLRCHYCGYSTAVPANCPQCGSSRVLMQGFGTEKIEEELGYLFPDAVVRRMDLDTTRSKHGHQKIINAFENREIDILVGTQMVTKGLDFDHVSMVGIMNADNMLGFPDFRSFERSFQLMAQVAGRAGRKKKQGKVIIQTFNPDHEVISDVVANDFTGLFDRQMNDRNRFRYPPYYRLIEVRLLHRDYRLLNDAARVLGTQLHNAFPGMVLGPEYPLVARIKDQYIKQMLIKVPRKESVRKLKAELQVQLDDFSTLKDYKRVRIRVDVDPY